MMLLKLVILIGAAGLLTAFVLRAMRSHAAPPRIPVRDERALQCSNCGAPLPRTGPCACDGSA